MTDFCRQLLGADLEPHRARARAHDALLRHLPRERTRLVHARAPDTRAASHARARTGRLRLKTCRCDFCGCTNGGPRATALAAPPTHLVRARAAGIRDHSLDAPIAGGPMPEPPFSAGPIELATSQQRRSPAGDRLDAEAGRTQVSGR